MNLNNSSWVGRLHGMLKFVSNPLFYLEILYFHLTDSAIEFHHRNGRILTCKIHALEPRQFASTYLTAVSPVLFGSANRAFTSIKAALANAA